jgi:hypothetical protein
MELNTSYKYAFDGKFYSILKVPIFKAVKDEARGEFTEKDLFKIVKNFDKMAKEDWYPRLFLGHHDPYSNVNRPGIGFLDNIVKEDDTIYADLVKIKQDIFEEIKDLKYPYRSVEIKTDAMEIKGLALLETQPPYFKFPLLNIADYSDKGVDSFFILGDMLLMGDYNKFEKKDSEKPEKEDTTPREEDGPNSEETIAKEENKEEQPPMNKQEEPANQVAKVDNTGSLEVKMDKLTGLIEKLLLLEMAEQLKKDNVMEGKDMTMGIKPGSISLQDEVNSLKEKVLELTVENKLTAMFSDTKTREYHNKVLSLIKPDEKEKYLNLLDKDTANFQNHPAFDALEHFKSDDSVTSVNILSKYKDKPITIRNAAKEALMSWNETINHPNEKYRQSFQSSGFSKADDFVQHVVNMEELQPNYLKTLTV